MEDKPKMYQNRENKIFHNNEIIYSSINKDDNINYLFDIRDKILNIINSKNFIYSKLVNIVIGNETIRKRIVGIYNNNLLTIDNEYIPIERIKDIYI